MTKFRLWLDKRRLWLARLLLPRGWRAIHWWQEGVIAACAAKCCTSLRVSVEALNDSGAWALLIDGKRVLSHGAHADTRTQDQMDSGEAL